MGSESGCDLARSIPKSYGGSQDADEVALSQHHNAPHFKSSTQILVHHNEQQLHKESDLLSYKAQSYMTSRAASPVHIDVVAVHKVRRTVAIQQHTGDNSSDGCGGTNKYNHQRSESSMGLCTVGEITTAGGEEQLNNLQVMQPQMTTLDDFGGSSSQLLTMQLKYEENQRQKLENNQIQTQQDLVDLQNQVRLMQKMLASQATSKANSNTKADPMAESSLLHRNIKTFTHSLETSNQQLLSESCLISPTPLGI